MTSWCVFQFHVGSSCQAGILPFKSTLPLTCSQSSSLQCSWSPDGNVKHKIPCSLQRLLGWVDSGFIKSCLASVVDKMKLPASNRGPSSAFVLSEAIVELVISSEGRWIWANLDPKPGGGAKRMCCYLFIFHPLGFGLGWREEKRMLSETQFDIWYLRVNHKIHLPQFKVFMRWFWVWRTDLFICVCMLMVSIERSEDSVWELVLPVYLWVLGIELRLVGKRPYLLSLLPGLVKNVTQFSVTSY